MLVILFYDEKKIQWAFSTGNLYNLLVAYAFDFRGLAEFGSTA